jgi:endonuclease-3
MTARKSGAGWAVKVAAGLKNLYPTARVSLDHANPLELLVATILSAQCADERVNQVTKTLFKKYRSAADYAISPPGELEEDIHSTGFYKIKAKSIRKCAADIVAKHGGAVPRTMEELTALAGVGRKTANVILSQAFGQPGVVVDTHVIRVSGRLGLTLHEEPEKIERDLMAQLPEREWADFSGRMILFGRNICKARLPLCSQCSLLADCPWEGKTLSRP